MTSPYDGLQPQQWQAKTYELVDQYPLNSLAMYQIVLKTWDDIFASEIGSKPFRIGQDIVPAPQIMGFLLHELIPLELAFRYPDQWKKGSRTDEKDVVYLPDDVYSFEIKTSSSPRNIYGNRSYAQAALNIKKDKSGFYLAINFQKFSSDRVHPKINLVRFGWLDHADWLGQAAATGQQARLSPDVERYKLLKLPLEQQ